MIVSPELLYWFAHKPTTRLLTKVRCVFVGDWVLLCCSGSAGLVGESFGDVVLRPSARHLAFGSDYSIVAPPGLGAYGAWVLKSQNSLLVSGRFGWVGLLPSFGGSPLGLLVSWECLSHLVSFVHV